MGSWVDGWSWGCGSNRVTRLWLQVDLASGGDGGWWLMIDDGGFLFIYLFIFLLWGRERERENKKE